MATKYKGKKFGRLTVLDGWGERTSGGNPKMIFRVRCDCGYEYTRTATSILFCKTPHKQQCATCVKEQNQKKSAVGYRHPLHLVWVAMVNRCYDPAAAQYCNYGGRGIRVCDAWLGSRPNGERATKDGFQHFLKDMGPRPHGYTIDRIDNEANYSPENCRWATHKTQANNTRVNMLVTLNGRTLTATQWGELLKHPHPSVWVERAKFWGVPYDEALRRLVEHYPKPVGKWKKLFHG
jgi:hypothetical protein